jgi:hypothetical protein
MQDNLARQSAPPGYCLLEDEECLLVRNAMQGRVVWEEIRYQDFGAKESAGFFDHVVRKKTKELSSGFSGASSGRW